MEFFDPTIPRPFGYLTRAHIKRHARWTNHYDPNTLDVYLANKYVPPLEPVYRAGGQYMYTEAEVLRWFDALEKWIAEAPARAAAKKAEEAERMRYAQEQEMKRIETMQMMIRSDQEARDRFLAERAEWVKATTGG